MPAHPRSRGEHGGAVCRLLLLCGSSPLARGTRPDPTRAGGLSRLIPARAGNTVGGFDLVGASSAHPRSRGEHQCLIRNWRPRFGSSPLARGTPRSAMLLRPLRRLIPARAGNTKSSGTSAPYRSAHPRSRGEHIFQKSLAAGHGGSSPLARGTQDNYGEELLEVRLIPARAGNTPHHAAGAGFGAAHPRSRGEHGTIAPKSMLSHGSSPLARGTHPCSAF